MIEGTMTTSMTPPTPNTIPKYKILQAAIRVQQKGMQHAAVGGD